MPSAIVLSLLRRLVFLLLPAVIILAVPRVVWAQSGGNAAAQSQNQSATKKQGAPANGAKATARPKAPLAASGAEQEATLEAKQQRQVGRIYYADGDVDVRYENTRLRADHVEYNEDTQVVTARGHVQLDYETQHVEAEDARYEVNTGRGTFHHVRATFAVQRHATPTLLISPNPIYFEAEEAERLDPTTYRVH
ncbi:MAG: LptA/OstA family protein, partial [Candidatus Acidiferrales bacterium]